MEKSLRRRQRGRKLSKEVTADVDVDGGIQFRISVPTGSENEMGFASRQRAGGKRKADAAFTDGDVDVSTELDGSQFRISLSSDKVESSTADSKRPQGDGTGWSGKKRSMEDPLPHTLAMILREFGKSISNDDASRELASILAKLDASRGRKGQGREASQGLTIEAVKVFLDGHGLILEKRSDGDSTKWTVLHPEGGPFMLMMKVWLKTDEDPDGSDTFEIRAILYHNRHLKDHASRETPCHVGTSDLANGQKAGRVFDRFFSGAQRTDRVSYKKCSLVLSWEIKKRNPRWADSDFHREVLPVGGETTEEDRGWPDYHRESLPEAVALIVAGLDVNANGAEVRQELASITTAAAENNATGSGNLNMGVVSGFLANRGFVCMELNEYAGRGRVLREPEGYFLLILSVFLKNEFGRHSYQHHAISCHKKLLRDCLTTKAAIHVGRIDDLSEEKFEDVFDAHLKEASRTRDVQYKHCSVIGAWVIAKTNELPESLRVELSRERRGRTSILPSRRAMSFESPEAKSEDVDAGSTPERLPSVSWPHGRMAATAWDAREHGHHASTSEKISRRPKGAHEGGYEGRMLQSYSISPRSDSGNDATPWQGFASLPKRERFKPITGEYTSIPDALAILLKTMNIKADDVPHDRLDHDQWLESVARYIKQPVTRYLDSKGLKLEPLPQGVLNSHLNILRERHGSHLLILSIHFEDDKHGHVPRMTHGLAWLARERLLVDGRTLGNPRKVTNRDMATELAAARLFDSFLRPLADSNRVYRFSCVRCAYRIKKCFSTKPANHYHRGPMVDWWPPEC
jgi:hypothetical protein